MTHNNSKFMSIGVDGRWNTDIHDSNLCGFYGIEEHGSGCYTTGKGHGGAAQEAATINCWGHGK